MKKICVILVNYNGKKYNDSCIKSILKSTVIHEIQIVIVDNASTDDSLVALYNVWRNNDQITIIPLNQNYGFAKANNVGIEWALSNDFDYVLLLNNDTEIAIDAVENMVDAYERERAIIVPKIVYADTPDILWCAGGELSKYIWKPLQRGINQKNDGSYDLCGKCSFANGCCMLLSKEIILQLGLLDERFFLYYEDTEYSMRARKKNVSIWYCAEALVRHKVNGSSEGNEKPANAYYITRNWLLCNKMYMHRRFLLFLVYFCMNRLAWVLIWTLMKKRNNVIAMWHGIWDFINSKYGKYTRNLEFPQNVTEK